MPANNIQTPKEITVFKYLLIDSREATDICEEKENGVYSVYEYPEF